MGTHLAREGFDDQNVCFIFCVDYPSVHGPGGQRTLTVGRRMGRRTELRTILSTGDQGWASGRRDGASVSTHWSSTTVGALMTIDVTPALRLGAGPLLGWLRSGNGVPGNPFTADPETQVVRPGLMMEAGLRSSATKRVFLDLSASYRLLGSRSEGPFPSEYFLGDPGPDLPLFSANYSSLTLGLGLGVRF